MAHHHHHHHSSRELRLPVWTIGLMAALILLGCMMPYLGTGSRSLADRAVSTVSSVTLLESRLNVAATVLSAYSADAADTLLQVPAVSVQRALNDTDLVAPKPDPDGYSTASSVNELSWLPQTAAGLLEGQELYFFSGRTLKPGAPIRWYLDDSIAVVTWKEIVGYTVLTFAEVKIADGSQFRRFLADGRYGADTQYYTTEMAQTVNAVLASSGDFYRFRYSGIVVYEGLVRRVNTNKADTCCITDSGDLLFLPQDVVMTQAEAQDFVNENKVRFSLTFGPILVDNYTQCDPDYYELGQINSPGPRAALCQLGERHYLLVTSNAEDGYPGALTMRQFADRIAETGCEKAYALDGGQTAALALDGTLVNRPLYGQQRAISDIIYFATSTERN